MANNDAPGVIAKGQSPQAAALTIKTSERGWLAQLAKAYRNHERIVVMDDANVGIDPGHESLLGMGLKAGLTRKEWIAVVIGVGISVFGATTIVLAILDPEPTSKLGLLVASGAAMTLGGGFSAIRILTEHKPPKVAMTKSGIDIEWN
jgi:hypothetical protein